MTTTPTTRQAPAPADPAAPLRATRRTRVLALVVLVVAVLLAAGTSIVLGSRDVSWADIWAGVSGGTDGFAQAAVAKRVPRTLLAAAAGAGLVGSDGQVRPTIFAEMSALAAETGALNLGQGFPDEDGPAEVLEAERRGGLRLLALAAGALEHVHGLFAAAL